MYQRMDYQAPIIRNAFHRSIMMWQSILQEYAQLATRLTTATQSQRQPLGPQPLSTKVLVARRKSPDESPSPVPVL